MGERDETESIGNGGDGARAVEDRVRDIADAYLKALRAGEAPDIDSIVAEHLEIAERLRPRLELIAMFGGIGADSGETVDVLQPDRDLAEELPRDLGKFHVLKVLGRGAFGTVYLARDSELDRDVTLKVPRAGVFQGAEEEARFFREARSTASLRHPGIVQVHDITRLGGVAVIVREYIDGQTLEEQSSSEGEVDLEFDAIAELLALTAEALEYAHREGVIHRDIKPANILIDAQGRPHVTDFGLARRGEGEASMTLDGQILGTPAYMSPEQALGRRDVVGLRSDVYSLGVVLYELLTGSCPFTGMRSAVIQQVIHDEPRPPRHLNARTPLDLETICLKAIEKEPQRRYASAADMALDLRRFLRHEPILARPITRPERLWRWCRRRPALASLSGAVMLLVLALVLGSVIAAVYFEDQAQRSNRQLVRMHVRTGMNHLDNGELFDGLPYLVEALVTDRDPSRERIHRLRLGSALADCPRLVRIWRDEGELTDADFSPDGRYLAMAIDGAVRIWQIETGELAAPVLEHGQRVRDLAFESRGELLATASSGSVARIWRWQSGELATPPLVHDDSVRTVAFAEDRTRLVTASWDGTAAVWNVSSGERVTTFRHPARVDDAQFTGAGHRVLTRSQDGVTRLWGVGSAEASLELPVVRDLVHVEPSPDGRRILVVSLNREARIFDVATGEQVGPDMEHDLGVIHATFSPDGGRLALACWGSTARIFDLTSFEPITPPLSQGISQQSAIFSPDGRRLATVGANGTVMVWNVRDGNRVLPPFRSDETIRFVRYGPNGHLLLLVTASGKASLWDTARQQPSLPTIGAGGEPEEIAVTPDGRHVAVAGRRGSAAIWSIETGRVVRLLLKGKKLDYVDIGADGKFVATVGSDQTARVWKLATGELSHELPLSSRGRIVRVDPQGRWLGTGEQNGAVILWDLATGEPHRLASFGGAAITLEFTGDGRRVAAGSLDGTLRVWDTTTFEAVGPLLNNGGRVLEIALDESGQRVASGAPGLQRVWDVASGRELARLDGNKVEMRVVRFDPEYRRVLTGDSSGVGYVWDWSASEGRTPISRARTRRIAHRGQIFDGDFDPDGHRVALCSGDGTARVWDPESGEPISRAFHHPKRIDALEFSPDGELLITASFDGVVRSWDMPLESRSRDDLELLTRVLTGFRLDQAHGGLEFVDSGSVARDWERARRRLKDEFSLHPGEARSWHHNQYLSAYRERDWHAVIFHLDRLIDDDTDDWLLFNHRGAAKQWLGRLTDAFQDGLKANFLKMRDMARNDGRKRARSPEPPDMPLADD